MYNLSTDYERLYQLMQEGKDPVCIKGKYLFQFIQDDLEMYFDKESFITYCKDFDLRWIDPQPVAERFFFIDEIRTWVNQLQAEEITIGKFIELLNEKATGLNKEEVLRSCYSIVQRKGADTNWEAIEKVLKNILDEQHKAISDPQPVETKHNDVDYIFKLGQQSIIEKLKALQRFDITADGAYNGTRISPDIIEDMTGNWVGISDIETIINQSK